MIGIYGGGSFGTALACWIARSIGTVRLFLRDENVKNEIINSRTNSKYFGNILLSHNINPSCDINHIINCEIIILSIPSCSFDEALLSLKRANLSDKSILLITTKGFCDNPFSLLSAKVEAIFPNNPICFMAGPNIAKDIVLDCFTTATIASDDLEIAKKLADSLSTKNFVLDTSNDMVTLQVSAAMKNIIAIGAGIYDARDLGQNAIASLVVAGLQDIKTLSRFLKSHSEILLDATLLQTGVLGDLMLTCYSKTSRNRNFGYEIALDAWLNHNDIVLEGLTAVHILKKFKDASNLNLPIVSLVAENINYKGKFHR